MIDNENERLVYIYIYKAAIFILLVLKILSFFVKNKNDVVISLSINASLVVN